MTGKLPAISQLNLVAKHFEETLRFYRMMGLDISEPTTEPPGALHAPANVNTDPPRNIAMHSPLTTKISRASTMPAGEVQEENVLS